MGVKNRKNIIQDILIWTTVLFSLGLLLFTLQTLSKEKESTLNNPDEILLSLETPLKYDNKNINLFEDPLDAKDYNSYSLMFDPISIQLTNYEYLRGLTQIKNQNLFNLKGNDLKGLWNNLNLSVKGIEKSFTYISPNNRTLIKASLSKKGNHNKFNYSTELNRGLKSPCLDFKVSCFALDRNNLLREYSYNVTTKFNTIKYLETSSIYTHLHGINSVTELNFNKKLSPKYKTVTEIVLKKGKSDNLFYAGVNSRRFEGEKLVKTYHKTINSSNNKH
ncbi:MAG: hypothetical protein ACEPOV_11605 [Hyphomicrobiales bacterium]